MYFYTFIVFCFCLGVHDLLIAGTLTSATTTGQGEPDNHSNYKVAPRCSKPPISRSEYLLPDVVRFRKNFD